MTWLGTVALVMVGGGLAVAAPAYGTAVKTVSYLGYSFQIPVSWPVIRNASGGVSCVRFDQHAVYLGKVGANQDCPSWLFGTTEAVLIEPGPARAARGSVENPVARQIDARAPGLALTATFGTDPAVIYQILASAGLPSPSVVRPDPLPVAGGAGAAATAGSAGLAGAAVTAATRLGTGRAAAMSLTSPTPVRSPSLPITVTNYLGLGFDACAAPSTAYMNAWLRASPYRAIGIYIGGSDRACAQPNLSPAWIRQQARNGWHFLPLYVGPQAAYGELKNPAAQAPAAAADAVQQAQQLGFGPATPIYYDMEAYSPNARTLALGFLSAWTNALHKLGYSSGVYSSSASGIADLAANYSGNAYAMPDVIYDALWNGVANTADSRLKAGQWANHQRVHQYVGNVTQTYGGDSINVDKDYLDVQLRQVGGSAQASQAIALASGAAYVFFRGAKREIYLARYQPGSGWASAVATGSIAASIPAVVWTGSAIDLFYTDTSGYLWQDQYSTSGSLIDRTRLTMMGRLGSAPAAVAAPGGAIDVFWKGSADRHLWHGQYLPGTGWAGPQDLGGALSSPPAPVISAAGSTDVFFEGTDRELWYASRGLSGSWSAPVSLGMGPLGGPPLATAQSDGAIQVYWHGSADSHLWQAYYQPGSGWRGPVGLGGSLSSGPAPLTAGGTVSVFWRGPGNQLNVLSHQPGATWGSGGWEGPVTVTSSKLSSRTPFGAVGPAGDAGWAFYLDTAGRLWATSQGTSGGWTTPVRIGT